MPTTRRSAAQLLPPAGEPLAENAPARKNQGRKKVDNITIPEAPLQVMAPLAHANPPTTPAPAAQRKRGQRAVVTASDGEDGCDAPRNKRAKNTMAGTTNTMAVVAKPHKPGHVNLRRLRLRQPLRKQSNRPPRRGWITQSAAWPKYRLTKIRRGPISQRKVSAHRQQSEDSESEAWRKWKRSPWSR
jgi:hypothetical protein